MPEIAAFRGLRYDLGHVGALAEVTAPPYDVISPEYQDALYKRHPANVIRLILNREEPGDNEQSNRYQRAAQFLKNWRSEGVLQTEGTPALYVYHQEFSAAGKTFTRRGFMSRVRLERFGEGKIYPHEETHSAAKADRLKLFKACKANLSPVFGLYPDPENEAQQLLDAAIAGVAPLEATDDLGVIHRLWPVTDVKIIGEVSAVVEQKPLFIADGHHRYETACNYRDELAAEGELPDSHPANFVMAMNVSMTDPGMIVLPTHRLFRGLPELSAAELREKLGDCFECSAAGTGLEAANSAWETIEFENEQGLLCFFTQKDQTWTLARITETGRQKMAELSTDHSSHWQGLGVSILQRLVLENLLAAGKLPSPKYVHDVEEVIEGIEKGDSAGRDATGQMGAAGHFPLICLVMSATIEHVRLISEEGERMPAKSTYFYPKLLSGLVIHPLEG